MNYLGQGFLSRLACNSASGSAGVGTPADGTFIFAVQIIPFKTSLRTFSLPQFL